MHTQTRSSYASVMGRAHPQRRRRHDRSDVNRYTTQCKMMAQIFYPACDINTERVSEWGHHAHIKQLFPQNFPRPSLGKAFVSVKIAVS